MIRQLDTFGAIPAYITLVENALQSIQITIFHECLSNYTQFRDQ